MRKRTRCFSVSLISVTSLRFGKNRRRDLLFAWLTLLPVWTALPVNSQRLAMANNPLSSADRPLGPPHVEFLSEEAPSYSDAAFARQADTFVTILAPVTDCAYSDFDEPKSVMTKPRRHFELVHRRSLGAAMLLVALLVAAMPVGAAPPADTGSATRFEATYSIIIRGITLGHAKAETRFVGDGYAAAVKGAISGLLRLFTDLTADLAGSGRIDGDRTLPNSYDFATTQGKSSMHVTIAMTDGKVTDVNAAPPAKPVPDRVPVTANDTSEVVDPLSAFLVAVGPLEKVDGETVCNRTVKVFDGWQRFDLRLSYKETRRIKGRGQGYAGDVYRCQARYVPISGHRENTKSVKQMVDNQRLEVWLAPIAGTQMLAPYKILIGDTNLGDLIVVATRFVVEKTENRASAN